MRFVQVHTFYDHYLRAFYDARPKFIEQPYAEQQRILFDDGFSAAHLFANYLTPEHGFEAQFLLANCPEMQVRWMMEHGLREFDQHDWIHDIVRRQIEHIRPEVLYLTNPIDFDSKFIRSLSYRPAMILGWRAATIPKESDFSEFDLLLTSEPYSAETLRTQGAREVQIFFPAFPEWLAERVRHEPKCYDVSFCGQITQDHKKRAELVEVLSREAVSSKRFTPAFFLHHAQSATFSHAFQFMHPARWGIEMHREIIRGKIGINCIIDFAKGEAGNMRQFEVTGTGSFLLTEYHPKLQEHFSIGSEIETYKDYNELIEKVHYYLAHEEAREEIARRGQARCFKDHGMTHRIRGFADIIHSFLKRKGTTMNTSAKTLQPILSGSYGDVLTILSKTLDSYPRRVPGVLEIEGKIMHYADLHSFYHQSIQIFSQKLYDYSCPKSEPLILDCGGHTGLAALYFKSKFPHSRILAFEADPAIADLYRKNMAAYGIEDVEVRAQAVWVHANGVIFNCAADDSGAVTQSGTAGKSLPSVRFRDILGAQKVDLVKMDIEGAEFDVLADCADVLKNAAAYVVEVHMLGGQGRLSQLIKVFEDAGFHYMLSDLHHASWLPAVHTPPFQECKGDKFLVTVFAWQ